jgi:hypothetical protein
MGITSRIRKKEEKAASEYLHSETWRSNEQRIRYNCRKRTELNRSNFE